MKNKLLAVLATFGLVASASAVKINDNISINGFIDGSYVSTDTNAVNDDNDLDIDEVELNFIVNAGNVSGEIHIDDSEDGNGANQNFDLEQAHFTYSASNGIDIQVGRFGSDLGFEREDPAGLYTFSRAYGANAFNLGNVDIAAQEGVRLSYSADVFSASFAAYNPAGVAEESSAPAAQDDLNYELSLAFNGVENLSLGGGVQGVRAADAGEDVDTTNIYATYTYNKILFAAEYVNIDDEDNNDGDRSAYLILADYDINAKLGLSVRYSEWETGANAESDQITIAPNYAITDSLGAILEYSSAEDNNGNEADTLALELTFTF
jgi:hypothetical protein